jgi:hypothetical protein
VLRVQLLIFIEEAEAELPDKLKKLLLEVIGKRCMNLEHSLDILSEVIARRPPTDYYYKNCDNLCRRCKAECICHRLSLR